MKNSVALIVRVYVGEFSYYCHQQLEGSSDSLALMFNANLFFVTATIILLIVKINVRSIQPTMFPIVKAIKTQNSQ